MFADLFTHADHYPNQPGYRHTDTSEAAAASVAPKAKVVREKVLACIHAHKHGLTTEEIAAQIGIAYATVQPRTSELRAKGLIFDSGIRRLNTSSGKNAIVWCGAVEARVAHNHEVAGFDSPPPQPNVEAGV